MFDLESYKKRLDEIKERISELLELLNLKFSVEDFLGFDKIHTKEITINLGVDEDIEEIEKRLVYKIYASENFRDNYDLEEIKLRTKIKGVSQYAKVGRFKNIKHQLIFLSKAKVKKLNEDEISEQIGFMLELIALFDSHKSILSLIKSENDLISCKSKAKQYASIIKNYNLGSSTGISDEQHILNDFVKQLEQEERIRKDNRSEFLSSKNYKKK